MLISLGARPGARRLHERQRPAVRDCTCRPTPRSRTTTACTATGRSRTCSPRPRSTPPATTRGRCRAGHRLTADERAEAVASSPRLTGLSEDYVDRADLRIEHVRFFTELLRDAGLHRRPAGRPVHRLGPGLRPEHWDRDPSYTRSRARTPPPSTTTSATSSGTQNDLPYEILTEQGAAVVVQGVRGHAGRRSARQARRGDARQPAPQGAHRLRLPRRRDALLRPPSTSSPTCSIPDDAAGQHRGPLLRGRAT